MYYQDKIWIGDADGEKICILPKMANRHGFIAGATGTGKTITLRYLRNPSATRECLFFWRISRATCPACAAPERTVRT